jgi:glucose-6-phosphate dehydrogenase assembly protein OpcA
MNPFQTESVQIQDSMSEAVHSSSAYLFTLLVIATDIDKGTRCQQLVQLIAKKFPCKIIFAVLDSFHPENTLLMNRSIMTTKNGGGNISCDLLTIQASPDESTNLPFLILPEILADLPTFLLTAEPPFELPPSFQMLEPYIHRTIFEVSDIDNYPIFANSLIDYTKKIHVVDLNWARIEPWRMSLSRIFHSAKKLEQIHALEKIEIRYTKRKKDYSSNTKIQAFLLQSWLATRLKWKLESVEVKNEKILINYRTEKNNPFSLQVLSSESFFLEEGMVESIEITTTDGFHFLMAYENDDRHIVVHSSSNDRCELPLTFFVGSLQRGSTLSSEMFQHSISSQYIPVLEHLRNAEWEKIGKKIRN